MCNSIALGESADTSARLEVLSQSESGSLVFCSACRKFGLTFGVLHLRLDADGVLNLSQALRQLSNVELEPGQRHLVRLGGTVASLLLDPEDLSRLQHIADAGCAAALKNRPVAFRETTLSPASESWIH